jgi:sphingolipid 4-desaturase/C4-monooxygenase
MKMGQHLGAHVTRTDFEWMYDEEPHKSRRTEILKKYPGNDEIFVFVHCESFLIAFLTFPEIKQLFGHDPMFKWYCIGLVLLQVISLHFLQEKSWPVLLIVAYCFGGVINHSLSLAVHEISHNLSFGHARFV